jgi:hypothetical protein
VAYIGNQPTIGQYRKLDDISGSFNGSLTAFTMQVGSTNVSAGSAFQLLISLGGVIQNPGTDFTVSGSTLTFTTAPAASLSFFGILMGQPLNTATPGDSTVTGAKIVDGTITGGKLAAAFNYDSGLLFLDDTNNRVGVGTASASGKLHVSSGSSSGLVSADADDLIVENNGNCGITIASPNTGTGSIRFTDPQNNDSGVISYNHNDESLRFSAFATERARFDSLGRFLIGETATAGTQDAMLQVGGGNGSTTFNAVAIISGNDEVAGHIILDSSGSNSLGIHADPDNLRGSTNMSFYTDGTERMKITSAGNVGINVTPTAKLEAKEDTSSAETVVFRIKSNWSSSNQTQMLVLSDGDVENRNNAYRAISDAKLKENIADANSQWEDIKSLRVRNYNFIEGAGDPSKKHIGLIAQETELVSPGLVAERADQDNEGNDLGTTTKSVNYSVLYMKAVKALQEAMERIETLEAKVSALEAN